MQFKASYKNSLRILQTTSTWQRARRHVSTSSPRGSHGDTTNVTSAPQRPAYLARFMTFAEKNKTFFDSTASISLTFTAILGSFAILRHLFEKFEENDKKIGALTISLATER